MTYYSFPPKDTLTVTFVEILQGGHHLEGAQPSKRGPAVGSSEGRVSVQVCDGVGVDGEWDCQQVREG